MIIVKIWEGLGNQMFQYAFARALAQENKQEVVISSEKLENPLIPVAVHRNYGLKAFHITLRNVKLSSSTRWKFLSRTNWKDNLLFWLSQHRLLMTHVFGDKGRCFEYQSRLLHPKKHTCYIGHFQHPAYFSSIREILLEEFTLKKPIRMSKELDDIFKQDQTVAIHIRRGDYVKLNISLARSSYYKDAINFIENHVSNPTYVIFSDDPKWVSENMQFRGKTYFMNREKHLKDYEELMIMSRCDHQIIANSTFSWWGAWLNQSKDKIVIAPKTWIHAEHSQNIIPSEWVAM